MASKALEVVDLKFRQALLERYPLEGAKQIASEWAISVRQVSSCAYRLGVKSRSRELSETVNVDFFKTWSPDMAYILGFIWADGGVRCELEDNGKKRRYDLEFGLRESDKYHLENLRDILGSRHAVTVGDVFYYDIDGNRVMKRRARLIVSSKVLVLDLINLYQILPNKCNQDLPFPTYVPEPLFHHFVRGYFDGDGWAGVTNKGHLTLGFLGTKSFLNGLHQELCCRVGLPKNAMCQKEGSDIYDIRWSASNDVRKLRSWLYPPGTEYIRLNRKQDLVDSFLN